MSENSSQYCNQAQIYERVIQQFNTAGRVYTENALLLAKRKRTVCRDKGNGNILSEEIGVFSAPQQLLEIKINGDTGTADVTGSPRCPGEVLRFEMKKSGSN